MGATLAEVARALDVEPGRLREWTRRARNATGSGTASAGETVEQENRRLRRENATLRQEHALAIRVALYFAKASP